MPARLNINGKYNEVFFIHLRSLKTRRGVSPRTPMESGRTSKPGPQASYGESLYTGKGIAGSKIMYYYIYIKKSKGFEVLLR